MDHLSTLSSAVFRELSRFGDGDHSLIVRTDAQTFLELHRSGKQDFFTSHIAALMPNVVIKLQTPMSAQIVSALYVVSLHALTATDDPRFQPPSAGVHRSSGPPNTTPCCR